MKSFQGMKTITTNCSWKQLVAALKQHCHTPLPPPCQLVGWWPYSGSSPIQCKVFRICHIHQWLSRKLAINSECCIYQLLSRKLAINTECHIHQLLSRKLAINSSISWRPESWQSTWSSSFNISKENFQTQIRNVSSILQSMSVHIIPFRALQRKIPDVAYIHIHVQTDLHLYQKSSEEIQSPHPWDHRREKNFRNKTNIFKVTNKQTNKKTLFFAINTSKTQKKNWFSKLKKDHRSFDSESQRST